MYEITITYGSVRTTPLKLNLYGPRQGSTQILMLDRARNTPNNLGETMGSTMAFLSDESYIVVSYTR
jgi:hypothetical protein